MLSEVKKCSQGHTGQKRKGQDLNLDCLPSCPGLSTARHRWGSCVSSFSRYLGKGQGQGAGSEVRPQSLLIAAWSDSEGAPFLPLSVLGGWRLWPPWEEGGPRPSISAGVEGQNFLGAGLASVTSHQLPAVGERRLLRLCLL